MSAVLGVNFTETETLAVHADALDTSWVLLNAMLIFLMQLGFAMLEAGSVQEHSVVSLSD